MSVHFFHLSPLDMATYKKTLLETERKYLALKNAELCGETDDESCRAYNICGVYYLQQFFTLFVTIFL